MNRPPAFSLPISLPLSSGLAPNFTCSPGDFFQVRRPLQEENLLRLGYKSKRGQYFQ